jgi:hypothetical protein
LETNNSSPEYRLVREINATAGGAIRIISVGYIFEDNGW